MTKLVYGGVFLAAALALSACEKESALDIAAKNMNVASVNSVEYTGTGTWGMVGQAFNNSAAWAQMPVTRYTMQIDYTTPASRMTMVRGEPSEKEGAHVAFRKEYFAFLGPNAEEYLSGSSAWNVTATNPHAVVPQAVEMRQAEIISTPHGFLKLAQANNAPVRATRRGADTTFTVGKYRYYGRFTATGDLDLVQTWVDNPVLGDMLVQTTFQDYKDIGGVRYPTRMTRIVGDHPALRLNISGVKVNAPVTVAVPDEVKAYQPPPIMVTEELLAPGVWHLRGGSHHSLLIDQADHLVVVEAPQHEARSKAVIAKAKELVPDKPIRYIVNSHAHFDHSAGLRAYVAEGATIVTHAVNQEYFTKAWANPRTINPDDMATRKIGAKFQPVADQYTLTDGKRAIDIYAIRGSTHAEAIVMVYLPNEKIISVADIYAPAPADAPPPEAPLPGAVTLIENMERVGAVEVTKIAALHGTRVGTVEDLLIDSGRMQPRGAKAKPRAK